MIGSNFVALRYALIISAACLSLVSTAFAVDDVAGTLITITPNGGWSWFSDPRVLVNNNQLIVGSVAGVTGNGATAGDIRVGTLNLATNTATNFTLSAALERDDHDLPAFSILPDGRYMAVYERHGTDNLVRWRVSTNPGSTAAWNSEQTGSANPPSDGNGNTYANPFYLSVPNKIYNFSRSVGYDPNYTIFSNLTNPSPTFAYGGHWLYWMNPNNSGPGRPYVKYASNGTDKVWFLTTNDHPRDFANSLYSGYIQFDASGVGTVYKMDGSTIAGSNGQISTAQAPFPAPANNNAAAIASGTGYSYSPTAFTQIWAGNSNSVSSWANDVELGPDGNPFAVFSVRKNNPTSAYVANSMDYYYTKWNGTSWQTNRMGFAGSPLYNGENDYAGLAALVPADPNTVFVSTNYRPDTDAALAHWEIFKGVTSDGGATWAWSQITSNSTMDNVRPEVAMIDSTQYALVWMRGTYTAYNNFNTAAVTVIMTVPEPSTLGMMGVGAGGIIAFACRRSLVRPSVPALLEETHGLGDGMSVLR
jgi:hypothetical protein